MLKYFIASVVCLSFFGVHDSFQNHAEAFKWSTQFESGSAKGLHRRDDGAIGFRISEEPGGDERLWFYFKIQFDGKEQPEFVVENSEEAHQRGRRWKITKPIFSVDGKNWIRAGKTIYPILPRLTKWFAKPVFRFKAPLSADTLWVAYFHPYTNEQLGLFLKNIQRFPEVNVSSIGKTAESRDILKVDISRARLHRKSEDRIIWVMCREHPGETPASFVCEGLIQALLEHPAGRRLRQSYSFSIIPIVNVDGVARGYYYHNAKGINLALDWNEFESAEARVIKKAMGKDLNRKKVRMVINLHSANDPTKGHFFLKTAEDTLRPPDAELQSIILEMANGAHPQLQGHSPVKLWDLPGITGNALYREYGVYCLYLESNYNRGADGSLVTIQTLREVGEALVLTLEKALPG